MLTCTLPPQYAQPVHSSVQYMVLKSDNLTDSMTSTVASVTYAESDTNHNDDS